MQYEIRVKGWLDEAWGEWFDGLKLEHTPESETRLRGPLADQAALYGVLNKLRNLGTELVSVERVEDETETK